MLGLVRDRFLATYLGAGQHLDLYYAAFKIPDFLYVSVATLAAITVLLPYLSEKYGAGDNLGHDRAKKFLDQVFTVLLIFLVGISLLLFLVMPWLAKLVAPGFDVTALRTLTGLSRIMLSPANYYWYFKYAGKCYPNVQEVFCERSFASFLQSRIILGIVFLYPIFGVQGLAYGVILGALLHIGIQIPVLIQSRFIPSLTKDVSFSEIRSIVFTSIPRTIGLSMSAFTALILTSIASMLGTGSISIFNLTNNMLNVPIGIVGISYSVASFPTLVKFWNGNNRVEFAKHILDATRKIIFWSVPITILFIVLRAQIVRVILGSQSFSWNDTRLAAACLALFVIGLVAQSLVHLFVRGYYAAGNTKKPLIMNFAGEVLTIILAVVFLLVIGHSTKVTEFLQGVLRLDGIENIKILALPLAFSIGNIFNYFALWAVFKKDFPEANAYPIIRTTVQTITASLCMGIVTYGALNFLVVIFNQNRFWGIFFQGFVSGMFGILMFVTILIMLKNEDIFEFGHALRRKFWKADIVRDTVEIDKV
jgi:putative peptidoglycan lipid II flippase